MMIKQTCKLQILFEKVKAKPRSQRWLVTIGLTVVCVVVTLSTAGAVQPTHQEASAPENAQALPAVTAANVFKAPTTCAELCALSPGNLAKCDIALMNLLCAEGLRGSETLNISGCLATLDSWAGHLKNEIERNLYRYRADPGRFQNCEGRYRMGMLVTVLKQDMKVHYDDERSNDEPAEAFFADAGSVFINGMLGPRRAGTCGSIPVLVVALARRLGYPVKLVIARSHTFARWDDGKDRFNIEASNGGGMIEHPDDHYRTWPKPITEEMIAVEGYLKSLSPSEELAVFLQTRAVCLFVSGRKDETKRVCRKGLELLPSSKLFKFAY